MGLIKDGSSAVPQPHNSPVIVEADYKQVEQKVYQLITDPKSKRILIQGVIQAAVQSSVLQMFVTNPEEYWFQVEALAKKMIKFVEDNSQ